MPTLRKGTSAVVDIIQTVVIALSIYMVIHLFVIQPNKVDGNSMFPTLHSKERILANKIVYRFEPPKRGDIVVFTPPPELNGDFVKRIMAIPGDTITLKQGQVYVNNQLLNEPYLPAGLKTAEKAFLRENIPYTVPPGGYMVFGDNRNFSSDSRVWGPITRKSIIGRAWVKYWPLDTAHLLVR